MKVYEVVKIGREMMKTLHDSCVKMSDYQFVELYEKYVEMLALGEKTSSRIAGVTVGTDYNGDGLSPYIRYML